LSESPGSGPPGTPQRNRLLDLLLEKAAPILGRSLTLQESSLFNKYLELLLKWQRVHRLVGSSKPEWIVENLFLDSLLFLRVLPHEVTSVVDIGSGAGFPGIPIKIVRPSVDVVLVESRERRGSFLSTVIRECGLQRISVFIGRAEDVPRSMLGAFGAAIARCAGDPAELRPIAARLVRVGGLTIFSGPPARASGSSGEWVEVEGSRPGSVRRFLVGTVM
jgi:16S rRNA (guanine527-N7)-methyltransferase